MPEAAVVDDVHVIGKRGGAAAAGVVREPATRPPWPRRYPSQRNWQGVYLAYTDLCEIGHELARGVLEYTDDGGYWCLSCSQSWLRERPFLQLTEQEAELAREIIGHADVLHLCEYHNYPQLEWARRGTKMVMHHHGVAYRDDPLRWEQREIDAGYLRLVSTPDLLIYGSREGRKTLRWLPSPINVREIARNYPQGENRKVPRVLHAYTVASNKGSDFICSTLGNMRGVDFQIMHGVVRRESLWHIRQCDVYVATMLYGPGMASLEAMAMGIPVVLGCTPDERAAQEECYGNTLPFVWVTEQTLEREVRRLVEDRDWRRAVGQAGRRAVERLHDVPRVVDRLLALYAETPPAREIIREQVVV